MQGPYQGPGVMPPTGTTIPLGEEQPSKPVPPPGPYTAAPAPAAGVYAQNMQPQPPQQPGRPQPPAAGVYAMDGPPRTGAGVYAMSPTPNAPQPQQMPMGGGGGVYSTGLPPPQQAPSPYGATGLYAPNSPYDARNAPRPQVCPPAPYGGAPPPAQGGNIGYPVTPEQGGYRY